MCLNRSKASNSPALFRRHSIVVASMFRWTTPSQLLQTTSLPLGSRCTVLKIPRVSSTCELICLRLLGANPDTKPLSLVTQVSFVDTIIDDSCLKPSSGGPNAEVSSYAWQLALNLSEAFFFDSFADFDFLGTCTS